MLCLGYIESRHIERPPIAVVGQVAAMLLRTFMKCLLQSIQHHVGAGVRVWEGTRQPMTRYAMAPMAAHCEG